MGEKRGEGERSGEPERGSERFAVSSVILRFPCQYGYHTILPNTSVGKQMSTLIHNVP